VAAKRFKSKVDRWLIAILILAIVIDACGIIAFLRFESDPVVLTISVLVSLLVMALIASVSLGTHYTIDRNVLRIVSGPFRWKVPIDQITGVEATRSLLSSPALSLDRLRIQYGPRRRIMVSPADKAGFLKAIGHELSH